MSALRFSEYKFTNIVSYTNPTSIDPLIHKANVTVTTTGTATIADLDLVDAGHILIIEAASVTASETLTLSFTSKSWLTTQIIDTTGDNSVYIWNGTEWDILSASGTNMEYSKLHSGEIIEFYTQAPQNSDTTVADTNTAVLDNPITLDSSDFVVKTYISLNTYDTVEHRWVYYNLQRDTDGGGYSDVFVGERSGISVDSSGPNTQQHNVNYTDRPGAGTHTYRLECRTENGTVSLEAQFTYIRMEVIYLPASKQTDSTDDLSFA